jgi:hypothetical protein
MYSAASALMIAKEFVEHALHMAPRVYMLLRLGFLESDRRSSILDGGHLSRVHVFRKRLPMMHRNGWDGRQAGSAIAYAWFVWDRQHNTPISALVPLLAIKAWPLRGWVRITLISVRQQQAS